VGKNNWKILIMTTQEKISSIIADEWNNYKGRLLQAKLLEHAETRKELGDDMFLLYLEQQKAINPRPRYKVPKEIINLLSNELQQTVPM